MACHNKFWVTLSSVTNATEATWTFKHWGHRVSTPDNLALFCLVPRRAGSERLFFNCICVLAFHSSDTSNQSKSSHSSHTLIFKTKAICPQIFAFFCVAHDTPPPLTVDSTSTFIPHGAPLPEAPHMQHYYRARFPSFSSLSSDRGQSHMSSSL